jgi:hypothetical protein
MIIETVEFSGFVAMLRALRLPFDKEERSNVIFQSTHSNNEISYCSDVKIDDKDLALLHSLIKKGDDHAKVIRGLEVYAYMELPMYLMIELDTYRIGTDVLSTSSTMHKECKVLTGIELQDAKGSIPGSYIYRRIEKFSYQALRHIYFARLNHRLPEWQEFCKWIEGLPMSELIIGKKE